MSINIGGWSYLFSLVFDGRVDFLQTWDRFGNLFQDLMHCFGAGLSMVYVKFKGDSFDFWVKFIEDINNKLMFIIQITFIQLSMLYNYLYIYTWLFSKPIQESIIHHLILIVNLILEFLPYFLHCFFFIDTLVMGDDERIYLFALKLCYPGYGANYVTIFEFSIVPDFAKLRGIELS